MVSHGVRPTRVQAFAPLLTASFLANGCFYLAVLNSDLLLCKVDLVIFLLRSCCSAYKGSVWESLSTVTAPASVGVSFLVTLVGKCPLPSGDMFAALKLALGLVIGPLMLGLCSRCSPASDSTSESLSPEQSPPSVSSHKDTEVLCVFYLRCSTLHTLEYSQYSYHLRN